MKFGAFAMLSRAAGWIGVAAIVVVSTLPGSERPHTGLAGQIEHVLAYFMTAAELTAGYQRRDTRLKLLLRLMLLAAAMECAQLFIPGRNAAIGDFLASSLGALIGVASAAAAERHVWAPR
jgi:VanZ family protein